LVPFPALFLFICDFLSTVFILGDRLTRLLLRWYLLLLRWEKSAPLLPGLNQGQGAWRESNPGVPYSNPVR
jgi:hypothetical protein